MQVLWSEASQRDLEDIETRFEAIDLALSDRVIAEIEASTRRLGLFPRSAPRIAGTDLRKLSVARFDYLVLYRIKSRDSVEIVRVRHAHEDWLRR